MQADVVVQGDALQALDQQGILADQQRARGGTRGRQVTGHFQQRNLEPEIGPVPRRGADPDAPVHQVDDALADRQPQSGAAVDAGGGRVGLAERLEQSRLHRRFDADAAVDHLEAQQMLVAALALATHPQADAAALGELDRVHQQVAQHLAQSHRVAAYGQADRRVQFQGQGQALGLGGASHQLHQPLQQLAQIEGGGFQIEAFGLQAGIIQDVVDDPKQLLRAHGGGLQHLALVAGQLATRDQIEHRQDAVERSADLVAHGGQELALGQHRRFGRLLGLQQFLFECILLLQRAQQLVALTAQRSGAPLLCGDHVLQIMPAAHCDQCADQRDGGRAGGDGDPRFPQGDQGQCRGGGRQRGRGRRRPE